jgi:hypothetical protein
MKLTSNQIVKALVAAHPGLLTDEEVNGADLIQTLAELLDLSDDHSTLWKIAKQGTI